MIQNNKYKLFNNILIFKGHSRSIIIDFQRNKVDLIPNGMYAILKDNNLLVINKLNNIYGIENIETIKEYLNFLIKKEYVFNVKSLSENRFPKLNSDFQSPFKVSNAIIEIGNLLNFKTIINALLNLENLGCKYLELRILNSANPKNIHKILSHIEKVGFYSTNIFISYEYYLENRQTLNLDSFFKLLKIIIFKANKNEILNNFNFMINEFDNSCCGAINQNSFSINLSNVTESLKFNTCLNSKISIDQNGEIKNCPSMLKSFGNIKVNSMLEVIERIGFKEMWYINKDQIDICKDCEFRHICTDCRAYITDPNNKYSKPSKCSYDPYTATWGKENPTNNSLYGQ